MRQLIKVVALVIPIVVAFGPNQAVSAGERDEPKRMVLVELYTSQGCDMCPTAEKILGLARKPAVGLDVALEIGSDGRSGKATIKVTSQSAGAEKSPLLVCAVLREDGVVTAVKSGENGGKSLVARFPARQTKYEFIELDGKSPTTKDFTFTIQPSWNRQNLQLAAFVQDKRTGTIHQATNLLWRSTQTAASSNTKSARVVP